MNSTLNTRQVLQGSPSLIPTIANRITQEFQKEGYEVDKVQLTTGGYDISVTKGNLFKAVLGMKTAMKLSLSPVGSAIYFDANVGVFGQQLLPTIISTMVFWPIIFVQVNSLIKQFELDDKALAIAEKVCSENQSVAAPALSESAGEHKFCTSCGAKIDKSAKFCSACGQKL